MLTPSVIAPKRVEVAIVQLEKGRCVPTRFLRAKGTTSWRLALSRRLPAGRYAIYARAVDIAGRAGRIAAKDALIVRLR